MPPQPPGTPSDDGFERVFSRELERLPRRREVALGRRPTGDRRDDLVGLALSGGGLRSAIFNLGLLQAFRRYGLLRSVDYLSAVSGGGFIAGYLLTAGATTQEAEPRDAASTSAPSAPCAVGDEASRSDATNVEGAAAERPKSDGAARPRPAWPCSEAATSRTPADWLTPRDGQFRRAGLFLGDVFRFLSTHLFSTLPIFLFIVSSAVCVVAALAFAYRLFDLEIVRDHLAVAGLDVDLYAPFLPAACLAIVWLLFATLGWLRAQCADWSANVLAVAVGCLPPLAAMIGLSWGVAAISPATRTAAAIPSGLAGPLAYAATIGLSLLGVALMVTRRPAPEADAVPSGRSPSRPIAAVAWILAVPLVYLLLRTAPDAIHEAARIDWRGWIEASPAAAAAWTVAAVLGALAAVECVAPLDGRWRPASPHRRRWVASVAAVLAAGPPLVTLALSIRRLAGLTAGARVSSDGNWLWPADAGALDAELALLSIGGAAATLLFVLFAWTACVESSGSVGEATRSFPATLNLVTRLLLLSLFLGVVTLIGNENLGLGPVATLLGLSDGTALGQSSLRQPLLWVVAACLLPLLSWNRVTQSAKPSATFLERTTLKVTMSAAVLGVPLLAFGMFARENVSGFADDRDPRLLRSDVLDWRGFVFLTDRAMRRLGSASVRVPGPSDALGLRWRSLLRELDAQRAAEEELFGSPPWNGGEVEPWIGAVRAAGRERRGESPSEPGLGAWRRLVDARASSRVVLEGRRRLRRGQQELVDEWNRVLDRPGTTAAVCDEFLGTREGSRSGPASADEKLQLAKLLETCVANIEAASRRTNASSEADALRRLWPVAFNAATGGPADLRDPLTPLDRRRLNRLLLEGLFPRLVRPRTMVSTAVVVVADQYARADVVFVSFVVATAGFLLISANRLCSLFWYYHGRLSQWFLAPAVAGPGAVSGRTPLRELRPWTTGLPYPLFNATLHTTFEPSLECAVQGRTFGKSATQYVMSPLHCGEYDSSAEASRDPGITLADAVTISGGAVSPLVTENPALYWVLSLLNLRTTWWIRNPTSRLFCDSWARGFRRGWITPASIAGERLRSWYLAWVRELDGDPTNPPGTWAVGALTDGGVVDFLGVQQLFRRRCRIVICSDAGQNDADEENRQLAIALRTARQRWGVEIEDLDNHRPIDLDRLRSRGGTDADGRRFSPQHFVLGRILYPATTGSDGAADQPATVGLFVYIQMAVTGDEDVVVQQHHSVHKNFPNEHISNQFFDDDEVEAFRSLGFHTGSLLCRSLPRGPATSEGESALTPSLPWWSDGGAARSFAVPAVAAPSTEHLARRLEAAYVEACRAETAFARDDVSFATDADCDLPEPDHATVWDASHARESFELNQFERDVAGRRQQFSRVAKHLGWRVAADKSKTED